MSDYIRTPWGIRSKRWLIVVTSLGLLLLLAAAFGLRSPHPVVATAPYTPTPVQSFTVALVLCSGAFWVADTMLALFRVAWTGAPGLHGFGSKLAELLVQLCLFVLLYYGASVYGDAVWTYITQHSANALAELAAALAVILVIIISRLGAPPALAVAPVAGALVRPSAIALQASMSDAEIAAAVRNGLKDGGGRVIVVNEPAGGGSA